MKDETLEKALDGHILPGPRTAGYMKCDYCSKPVTDNEPVTVYVTDVDYTGNENGLYVCRVYCSNCNRNTIYFPLMSATEVLLSGRASYEPLPTFKDVSVIDRSDEGSGIAWNPADIWGQLFKFNLREFTRTEFPNSNFGPEDVVDQLRYWGYDIADIVNWEGEIALSPTEIKKMREDVFRKALGGY